MRNLDSMHGNTMFWNTNFPRFALVHADFPLQFVHTGTCHVHVFGTIFWQCTFALINTYSNVALLKKTMNWPIGYKLITLSTQVAPLAPTNQVLSGMGRCVCLEPRYCQSHSSVLYIMVHTCTQDIPVAEPTLSMSVAGISLRPNWCMGENPTYVLFP